MSNNNDKLIEFVNSNALIKSSEPDVIKADCDNIIFILDNCEITVPKENEFFISVNCSEIQRSTILTRAKKYENKIKDLGLKDGELALCYTGLYDFSHTTADWDSVISLGIYGLNERIKDYASRYKNDNKKQRFYSALNSVYSAALRFINRAAKKAEENNKIKMANGLKALAVRAPENLFEVMQTVIIYYVLQHIVEGTYLRTLGRIDKLFFPYYLKDKESAKGLIFNFLKEIDRLKAPSNIPFAVGGTDADGNSLINELSYVILDAYKSAKTTNTKFHVLCSHNTPDDFILSAFDGVKNGNNSMVFMSDGKIIESLKKMNAEHLDAVDYHVVGCYECGAFGELTCSCNARVNLPKALELCLNGGKDMLTDKLIGIKSPDDYKSFEELYNAFIKQAKYFCDCACRITDIYEKEYKFLHSSPILSATYISALERGGDLYTEYTAKYNNSSLNALGLGTVVDSLSAIRKLVYEDKTLTLKEFISILKNNWKDNELLRLRIKNKFPKFGVGDKKTDLLAKDIIDNLSAVVNGRKNVKGGIYRLGTFSIDWRWEFGEKTAASADGRLKGETISQNTGATFGADKEGATSLLRSICAIDATKTPNGSIADIDLHYSAVAGDNGAKALLATLKTYFALGGFAVHYNVLDTETLKRAKETPENYPNLQVRLCGWNVLFNSLSEKEKDEFILRSIKG
ncbi:MAG: DUF3029 family protein [Clostridia bacterium]|nr:DUF3029 family protein [Clostridia bacterium]